ncbi:hypothetical protein [Streptomonospora alba]|uniref:hypothetical protein n=1 Tax=Streptomonospora alba TaxID=183763 RepID=UPI0012ECF9C8|nr:hypothetical protein [Streptomonospora alba]
MPALSAGACRRRKYGPCTEHRSQRQTACALPADFEPEHVLVNGEALFADGARVDVEK